jgi:hypothetical protein
MKMTDEILKRLDVLAAKLGVTAGHLWGVLVAQAKIEAIEDIIWAALWAALSLVLGLVARKLYESNDENDNAALGIVLIGVAVGFLLISAAMISGTLGMLLNPEYWALKKVLEAMK